MPRGLTLTGGRARFSINGVKVAQAMGVDYGEEIQFDPIEPLDQYEVDEHVPIAYRVNLSAQVVRQITNSVKNRDGVRIFSGLADILTAPELTATITDPTTGTIIANIERVKASNINANLSRAITLTNISFVAIRILDESEIR